MDYLYTSCTNATAFSPTDTLPLTAMAKLLMALQSLIALVTILLVVSRAVNVLGCPRYSRCSSRARSTASPRLPTRSLA